MRFNIDEFKLRLTRQLVLLDGLKDVDFDRPAQEPKLPSCCPAREKSARDSASKNQNLRVAGLGRLRSQNIEAGEKTSAEEENRANNRVSGCRIKQPAC